MPRLRHRLALVLLRLASRLLPGYRVTIALAGAHGSTSTSYTLGARTTTTTSGGHIHWGS